MEALVENAANPPSRFYCHSCSVEIDRVSSDFTCPHCSQGFIEELPAANAGPPSPPPVPSEQDGNDFINPQAIRLASEIFSNSILSPLLLSTSGPRDSDSDGAVSLGGDGGGGGGGGDSGPAVRVLGRHRGSRGRRGMQNVNNLDNILREILISVADGANGGVGGTPMFFMGNPADYAWGREGLDTIVTQLLNQMDNTGPPPLEKEKIAEIPKVTISDDQVEMKLQCSVCWEDFQIDEVVRKLTCAHVYHESCIIPWLELHGTCPICRKSLAPEQQDEQRGLAAAASAVANTLRSLHSDAFPGAASQSSSSSLDEGGPSTSSLHIDFREPLLSFTARAGGGGGGGAPRTTTDSNGQHNANCPLGLHNSGSTPGGASSSSNNGSSNNSGGTGPGGPATGGSNSSSSRYRDDDGNIDYEFD